MRQIPTAPRAFRASPRQSPGPATKLAFGLAGLVAVLVFGILRVLKIAAQSMGMLQIANARLLGRATVCRGPTRSGTVAGRHHHLGAGRR